MKHTIMTAAILSLIFSAFVMGCTTSGNQYSNVEKDARWKIVNSDKYEGTLTLSPDGNGCLDYSIDGKSEPKICFRYQYSSRSEYMLTQDGKLHTFELLDGGYAKTSLLNEVVFLRERYI